MPLAPVDELVGATVPSPAVTVQLTVVAETGAPPLVITIRNGAASAAFGLACWASPLGAAIAIVATSLFPPVFEVLEPQPAMSASHPSAATGYHRDSIR